MKKLFTLLLLALLYAGNSYSQFVSYGFMSSTGTYEEITGGIVVGTETSDDQRFVDPTIPAGSTTVTGPGIPIGFDFVFNGITFDRFGINNNGWIGFGQSALTPAVNIYSSSSYTPLSSTSTASPALYRNRISVFGRDLQAQAGASIRIETIGTAPNRETVIQFKNYKRYGTTYAGESLNFQIRLQETTNFVELVYGPMTPVSTTSGTIQVGLGGNLNSEFLNRTSTTSWETSSPGSLNSSTLTFNTTVFPPSGLTYTFGPMAPLAALYSSPGNGSAGMPLDVSLNWAPNFGDGGGAPTGYRVYMGTDNPPTNVANGVDVGNTLTYQAPVSLDLNTVYYWQVIPYNAVGDATGNEIWSFTTTLGLGDLEGFVTNGFGIPLAGANINVTNGVSNYNTVSGANGAYTFDLIGAGPYTLTATLDTYNNTVMEVFVAPNTTTYQNIVMTRPSISVTPNPYSISVNPNEMVDGTLNIANNGDGILGWNATVSYTSPGPNTWLTLAQNTGTVNPYTNFNMPVAFNASGLTAGTVKTAEITFTSTPNVGTVVIPVTMTVSGVELTSPFNLVATLTNPVNGTVGLSWSFDTNPNFQFFIVKRDGVQVGTTTGNTFTNILPAYGVYSYTVQAVFADGNSSPAGPVTVEWANPVLVLEPTSLYNEQYPNTSEQVTFRISNTGEGTLAYSFPEYATRQLINSPGFTPNVPSTIQAVEVGKDEADPTDGMGNRNLRGAGGPDAFGYTWIDSDETGGPAYQWTDISATGTLVAGLADDNVVGPFPIGFSFPFYENFYTDVNVSSNGYLIFGSTSSSLTNQNIPSSTTPNNVIAWAWDDLHGQGTGSTVHYQNMGNYWIIQFTNYNEYPSTSTGKITAQVHLYNNGHIRIYYNSIVGGFDTSSLTVGIENNAGTVATNINYNSSYIHDGLAIAIDFPIPTFITSVVPAQGQVAPGEFVDVVATFTSNDIDFPVGTHTAELELNTNDLDNAVVMIPATMVVYEPGMLSGTVTSAVDGSPIFGATVVAGDYSAMTDENGNYSLVLDAGTYTVTFSKTGFSSVVVNDVVITETVTTDLDAVLDEMFYPVSFVYAEVNEADTEVEVTWGLPEPEYEILFDDGTAENFTAWALAGNMNAVKFTPAGYPATVYGGKIFIGDGSFPNNNTGLIGTTFGAMVMDDSGTNGLPGVVIDSVEVTVNNYGWVVFTGLDATIESGSFYLVMVQGGISPNVAPVGVDQTTPTAYRSYSRNVVAGQAWGLSPYQDMMIRALVSGPASDDNVRFAASTEVRSAMKQRGMISLTPATAQSGAEGDAQYRAVQNEMGSRDITGYSVWRIAVADPDAGAASGTLTLLNNNVASTNYTDNAFGPLPEGWYAYAVAANYTNGGQSELAYSNIVGHKKLVEVTVNVSLTTGGSPEGALVTLTGSIYPYSVLSETVPADGQIIFEDVVKGPYTILAQKVGFDNYVIEANIQTNRTFDIILAERKYKPRNLYVDPLTLVATWDEPLAIAVLEDFEGATFPPAGWQAITQNTTGWYGTTNGSSSAFVIPPHTKYAVTNDDADNGNGCCDYLITPEMDWTDLPTYRLNFASYYDGSYAQSAYVEISTDAGATWTVINTLAPAPGAWQEIEIDLAAYSGASGLGSVWLAFHADDNGEWASGWAVDDVQIASGGVPLQGYGVFLDGTLVGNTPETTWTYTNLNYGQTYIAGVAALFSSGYSELDTYRFTSVYLSPPDSLMGVNPDQTDYVHLTWIAPSGGGGVGGELFEDFETGVLSADWEIIETNTGTGTMTFHWSVNDYQSADIVPFGNYHAGLWWDYGHQDEWLITPELNCVEGTTLTFETAVYEGSIYLDHYYVKVSTDGGSTWTPVWDASTLTGNGWNYYDYNYTVDLSAFAGESIKVAFNAVDGDGQGLWYVWFVDNISISTVTDGVTFRGNELERISNSTNSNRSNDQIARDGNTQRVSNHAFATRAATGLIGYNVYRDEELIAYVEHPTLEYYDLNLDPGTYTYHITAVYDLTPFGFAGQTGESMIEGPITVDVIYGYELPFVENFTTGLFETNQWTTNGENWHVAGQAGNPAPSAEFTYDPIQSDYSLSLTSFWLNGATVTDGRIYVDFDLKLDDIAATGEEELLVEVYNGSSWIQAASFVAEGDMDWEMQHIDITNAAQGNVFRVRFTATGVNTLNINNWQIDNVHIYSICEAPTNLVAELNPGHGDQVILTWEGPNTPPPGPSGWLFWDNGTNADAIGLQGGGTFNVAVRFTPAQLAEYAGTSLTKIRMFPFGAGGTLVLKVWTGANASQLVLSQPVATYTVGQWNEFNLNTPVMVTGTTELWFGYEVTHGAEYVAGCDAGPAVAGYGDMISLDGAVWESMSQAYALNYNWNLQGWVESVDGVTALQPISDNGVYGPVTANAKLTNSGVQSSSSVSVFSTDVTNGSRDLVGYNVYRRGELIATTTETTYLDDDPAISIFEEEWCYQVTAVYDNCESDFSNEDCVIITNSEVLDISAVNVYPNPSNNVVNIELTNDISQLVIYNYVGQVVTEVIIAKDKTIQLDVRNYDAGAYLIKFITRSGENFTKKIAVTK